MRTLTIVASAQFFVLKGGTGEIVAVLVVPRIKLMMTRMTMIMSVGRMQKVTRTMMKMTMKIMIDDDGDVKVDDVGVTMQKLPLLPPIQ